MQLHCAAGHRRRRWKTPRSRRPSIAAVSPVRAQRQRGCMTSSRAAAALVASLMPGCRPLGHRQRNPPHRPAADWLHGRHQPDLWHLQLSSSGAASRRLAARRHCGAVAGSRAAGRHAQPARDAQLAAAEGTPGARAGGAGAHSRALRQQRRSHAGALRVGVRSSRHTCLQLCACCARLCAVLLLPPALPARKHSIFGGRLDARCRVTARRGHCG